MRAPATSSASGDTGVTGIEGLVVLGQPVTPTPNQQIPLADWGYAIALEQKSQRIDTPTPGHHDFVTALDIFLTADHGGLPAQSEIQIGYAEANAQASEAAPLPKAPSRADDDGRSSRREPRNDGSRRCWPAARRDAGAERAGLRLSGLRASSYIDTYGALRGDVSGGWHHGDDIFAPLGAPLLAVAHGTVFSVGWNSVGGWRLWLRDDNGWQYYYAHLSAYSPLAVNGAVVNAGDVLGFVGNTGDAQGTPYHLHFEVHPVRLLGLGYDGAVDPTKYLDAWRRLQDVRFDTVGGWTPRRTPRTRRRPARSSCRAPTSRPQAGSTRRRCNARSRRPRQKGKAGCCFRRGSSPPPSRSAPSSLVEPLPLPPSYVKSSPPPNRRSESNLRVSAR